MYNNENSRKRILFCSNVYPPDFIGGAELIAHAQAKSLKNMGHDVTVFTGDIKTHGERHSLRFDEYEGLHVYRIHLQSIDYQPEFVNFHHKEIENHFISVLDRFDPEIVHFHNIIGLSLGCIHIAKSRGIKTVMTLHDHWGFCFKNTIINSKEAVCSDFNDCSNCMSFIHDGEMRNIPIKMRKDYFSIQLCHVDMFISPSQYLADTYVKAGFPKNKFKVIWNGLDIKRFSSIKKEKSEKIRFTFVGHFGYHKGVQFLLEALNKLKNRDHIMINLVGDGEQRNNYEKYIKENNLEKNIEFWGKVKNENIEKVYSQTDILILPSIWNENQPVSITEAMAARIPVIASNAGGIPEMIIHNKTGFLFSPGNSNELAETMSKFLENPELIQLLGEKSYEKIENNLYENQVSKILKTYDEISPTPSNQNNDNLIALVGDKINNDFANAINRLDAGIQKKYKFVHADWLQNDQLLNAKILCVVDSKKWLEYTMLAINNGIPLLVQESIEELKDICLKANCGLYFSDSTEAELCMKYLFANETVRSELGINAKDYFVKTELS
ncbi:glycosyltransferase family 4 protein [Paenibacillus sp. GCM10012303]|uniref:glycosyltransferase family 4 protein n=1 Tax=Paenibacillus sp. GCM10012303 TaxID=3317340 RepID=UPI00360F5F36